MPSGLVILRDEQLRAMGAVLFDQFVEQVVEHVREVFPRRALALGDAAVRAVVQKALARGKEHGLKRERNLTLFVDLYFALGEDWESMPGALWLRKILNDRSRSDDARIRLIYRRLPVRAPGAGDLP
jgi:hypothetical protein